MKCVEALPLLEPRVAYLVLPSTPDDVEDVVAYHQDGERLHSAHTLLRRRGLDYDAERQALILEDVATVQRRMIEDVARTSGIPPLLLDGGNYASTISRGKGTS